VIAAPARLLYAPTLSTKSRVRSEGEFDKNARGGVVHRYPDRCEMLGDHVMKRGNRGRRDAGKRSTEVNSM